MNEREKTADYLCDQLAGLSVKAHQSKLKVLAYLIEIAAMEAVRDARVKAAPC
jgi:hypothetical protein